MDFNELIAPRLNRDTLLNAFEFGRGSFDSWKESGLYVPVLNVGRGGSPTRATFTLLDAIRLNFIFWLTKHGCSEGMTREVVRPDGLLDQYLQGSFRGRTDEEDDIPVLEDEVWLYHYSSNLTRWHRAELPKFGIGDDEGYEGLPAFVVLDPAILVERTLKVTSIAADLPTMKWRPGSPTTV